MGERGGVPYTLVEPPVEIGIKVCITNDADNKDDDLVKGTLLLV